MTAEKKYQQALFIKFIVKLRMDLEGSSIQLKNLHEDQLLSFAIIVLPLIAIVILLGCFCFFSCLCARSRGLGGSADAELGTGTSTNRRNRGFLDDNSGVGWGGHSSGKELFTPGQGAAGTRPTRAQIRPAFQMGEDGEKEEDVENATGEKRTAEEDVVTVEEVIVEELLVEEGVHRWRLGQPFLTPAVTISRCDNFDHSDPKMSESPAQCHHPVLL